MGYQESENFAPNPTDMRGHVQTAGTSGAPEGDVRQVTDIFDVAHKQHLAAAVRALDPADEEVPASLVTLPTGNPVIAVDPDAAARRVQDAAAAALADTPAPAETTSEAPAEAAAEGDTNAQEASKATTW